MSRLSIESFLKINDKAGNELAIRSLTGNTGLERKLSSPDINRPGMNLFGYFDHFAFDRVQVFGKGESAYLYKIISENNLEPIDAVLAYNIPLIVFTSSIKPPDVFLAKAKERGISVFISELGTGDFIRKVTAILGEEFAPTVTVHGVFIEVFGIGVLIKGKSGVGKSEVALELIERGHRLIADDSVDFKRLYENQVIGLNNRTLKYNMEVRGLGIVNIARISGMSAIRDKKELELIINLENWDENKEYDRTGLEDYTEKILGVDIASHCIPVKPGRNIYVLIETAVKNLRLKELGYHSAREFNSRLVRIFEGKDDTNPL